METVIQAGDSGGQSENDDVSALDLRAAMGTFLTGVTIVTARCDDEIYVKRFVNKLPRQRKYRGT